MVMKVSYYIDAPVEKVFDYFKDPASGTSGMEVLDSKVTEEGVGTFLSWRLKFAGIPWEGLEVITDLVPNEHITEKSSSAVVGTWEYAFAPEGSGTRVTLEHRPRALWALPPLSNLVDVVTDRLSRAYVARLKESLETRAAVPPQRKPAATESAATKDTSAKAAATKPGK